MQPSSCLPLKEQSQLCQQAQWHIHGCCFCLRMHADYQIQSMTKLTIDQRREASATCSFTEKALKLTVPQTWPQHLLLSRTSWTAGCVSARHSAFQYRMNAVILGVPGYCQVIGLVTGREPEALPEQTQLLQHPSVMNSSKLL